MSDTHRLKRFAPSLEELRWSSHLIIFIVVAAVASCLCVQVHYLRDPEVDQVIVMQHGKIVGKGRYGTVASRRPYHSPTARR